MLVWFAETTLVATVLAAVALLAGRRLRLGPVARHALWLVVLVKLVAPPIVSWPWPSRWVRPWVELVGLPGDHTEAIDGVREIPPGLPEGEAPVSPDAVRPPAFRKSFPGLARVGRGALGIWAIASSALAVYQVGRVVRFRRRFRWAVPAPRWLVDEARCVGRRLGVRAPEILVLPGRASPMLWFLGRPRLLVPGWLVESLGVAAWQGILAHELAHLRRRDHWVRRLELAAGLLWWWNPLYWLTRRRLDAEAELACDEWAVRAFPEGRLAYAEALLHVCRSLSTAEPPVPALGVTGSGPSLERRVTMILSEPNPSRASTWVFLGAGVLALLALPGWSAPAASLQKADEPAALASSDAARAADPDRENTASDDDDAKASGKSKSADGSQEDDAIREAEAERARKVAAELTALKRQAASDVEAAKGKAEDEFARKLAAELAALKKQVGATVDGKGKASRARKLAAELAALKKQTGATVEAKGKAEALRARKLAEEAAALKRKAKAAADARHIPDTARTRDVTDARAALESYTNALAEKLRAVEAGRAMKDKAIDGSKKGRPTKVQRIRELRSLISKLSDELKALEDDYESGEQQ